LTPEDEEEMNNRLYPLLAILPLRNMVLFPGVVIQLLQDDKSIKLINDAIMLLENNWCRCTNQREDEDPTKMTFTAGTVAEFCEF
jgi:ATP-dependent Lon protease